ncbi:hypothetical protein B0H67DRAFT_558063 [Lasiosphaeris hirsuta]|uniref:Uncharacterized protein n=1 Tax=Lasiosphaeris hirsuta TaxID=260670 RepID=A0AA39ZXK4_9PEZI|nr:hypothetical protein B0H67DRAFT_558063 [Lasiosphaeris hirsuta]
MLDREEDISVAEKKTFDWIFEDPKADDLSWGNFRTWLREGDSLYWITGKAGSGKAGSGKSTLMNPMQETQEGLFRSLLYQVLVNHRELIPVIRSEIPFVKTDDLSGTWTKSRLERIFRRLTTQTVRQIKVFLFIDGLD